MSAPNATPGPWAADDVRYNRDFRTCLNVMSADGLRFVAAVSCDPHTDTAQINANAHLIAAAPELYDALEAFQQHVIRHSCVWDDAENGSHHHPIWTQVSSALAKARGDQS